MSLLTTPPLRSTPPPNRRKIIGVVAVYAVALTFGAALFSGSIPGLGGHITSNVVIAGHDYYSESYSIPFPQLGNNSTSPAPVAFHNITFWLWETGWYSQYGSYVHGNGTEPGGTSYSFVLGGLASNVSRAVLYISPDDRFAVAWSGEFFLQLMVEIPSA
ncbi:MAG: hypothetical protein L3J68_02040 [Thermoplasmata archaeon]|nr:hypothetical protein [Thermoplasmata archaeon]